MKPENWWRIKLAELIILSAAILIMGFSGGTFGWIYFILFIPTIIFTILFLIKNKVGFYLALLGDSLGTGLLLGLTATYLFITLSLGFWSAFAIILIAFLVQAAIFYCTWKSRFFFFERGKEPGKLVLFLFLGLIIVIAVLFSSLILILLASLKGAFNWFPHS